MSTDIENCPFCGSSNIAVGYHGQPAQTFHMRCVSCGAAGPTVNSSLPTGGAFPANVCESWNRRAIPLAPTPAAAEGQAGPEEWMRKAIAETRTAASLLNEGEFRGGMETACDEVETRMALDGESAPTAEPVAWMHDADGRVDVIHNEVKKLWLRVGQPHGFYREKVPCKVEHYTIPLFAAAHLPHDWSDKPPTEQAWYWHWNGSPDDAPFPLSVLYSGTARKCFVSMGQAGPDAVFCDVYGGYWMRIVEPAMPAEIDAAPTVKASQ